MGAAVERFSGSFLFGSKLSDLQLYFTGVFEDFGHIFLIRSKKSIKILKVGKIFRCVTSLYQYFFIYDKIYYMKLIVATHIVNISSSLAIISIRAMWCHFYIGLVCQNCFAHSVLVLITLSKALSKFVKGPIRSKTVQ